MAVLGQTPSLFREQPQSIGLTVTKIEHIEEELRQHWSLSGPPSRLKGAQNVVYATMMGDRDVIVRIADSTRRSSDQILAELEWIEHLHNNGVSVCRALPSAQGELFATLQNEGGEQYAVVFEKAPGGPLKGLSDVTPSLARTWGETMGVMHRVSRDFRPSIGNRPSVHEEGVHNLAAHVLQLQEPLAALEELVTWMRELPADPDAYGIVHTDFQCGNFHVHDGSIYVFDFDDCCYHWRIMEAANALYGLYFDASTADESLAAYAEVCEHLLDGFIAEFPAIAQWTHHLDRFIQYRIALLYCWCHNTRDIPAWLERCTPAWRQHLIDWSTRELLR